MIERVAGGLAAPAPAKVNLYLHVTGRRPDGYHLLDSLIAFAGFGDAIEVRPADRLGLIVDGPFAAHIPAGPENLILKAAEALAETAGIAVGAEIRLIKRLPVAAGIGGGSADAAATLQALSALWDVAIPAEDLDQIALELGADVPVCLAGCPAYVGGIGEQITAAPEMPPCWLVLANSGTALPTPDVFRRRKGTFSSMQRLAETPADARELAKLLSERRNDLTDAAIVLEPEIGVVLAELDLLPGALLSRMSGSGATCFAMFADREDAQVGAQLLAQEHPRWWIVATPLRN
jgi:4-diphosphocytidyl-2-C-methyl-D-erythritol kinase